MWEYEFSVTDAAVFMRLFLVLQSTDEEKTVYKHF